MMAIKCGGCGKEIELGRALPLGVDLVCNECYERMEEIARRGATEGLV